MVNASELEAMLKAVPGVTSVSTKPTQRDYYEHGKGPRDGLGAMLKQMVRRDMPSQIHLHGARLDDTVFITVGSQGRVPTTSSLLEGMMGSSPSSR